jgi:putative peptidoglycan lipid II flippase
MKFVRTFITSLKEPGSLKTLVFHTSWALTLTSGLSYVFGFLRDRIFAQTFGLSHTLDVYNAAFVVSDTLLQVIVMAALSAPFLPIFAKRYDKNPQDGFDYANQFLCWSFLVLGLAAVGAVFILPYIMDLLVPGFNAEERVQYVFLARILLISPFFFAVSSLYGKILLSFKEFFWWGLAPALYNVGIITGALLFGKKYGALGLVIGTLIGIVLHVSIRGLMVHSKKYKFRHALDFRWTPEMRETVMMTLPKLLQYGMVSFMLLQFTSVATKLGEGAVTAYNYARNFQSIPVSLLGISISLALYTSLCHDAAHGNAQKFKKDFRRDLIRITVYTTLAGIALAFISPVLVKLLLGGGKFTEENVQLVSRTLQVFCLSVPLESLMYLYHRGFYALRDTATPSLLHAAIMMATMVGAHLLAPVFGIFGIPLSFSAGLLLQILILAALYPRRLRKTFEPQ